MGPIEIIDLKIMDLNEVKDEHLRQVNDIDLQIERLENQRAYYLDDPVYRAEVEKEDELPF